MGLESSLRRVKLPPYTLNSGNTGATPMGLRRMREIVLGIGQTLPYTRSEPAHIGFGLQGIGND